MLNKNRSKDATTNVKNGKGRPLETKQQQSTTRPSPKSTKYNKSSSNKAKAKAKSKPVKSVNKLNQYINKIAFKLQSFEQQSTPITLQSATQPSFPLKKKENSLKLNISTQILLQQMHHCRNELSSDKRQVNCQKQEKICVKQNYNKLFDKALSSPHYLRNFRLKRNNIGYNNCQGKDLDLISKEIKQFRIQQNKNWKQINQQLDRYLNVEKVFMKDKTSPERYKYIERMLQKQAKNNYRWVQIQQKMIYNISFKQLSLDPLSDSEKKQQQKTLRLKEKLAKQEKITQKKVLKNYNWDKYVWNDNQQEQSSSQLIYHSDMNSETQQVQIKPFNLIQNDRQTQQNIDLVLNMLVDEFVMQLALKLDFNFIKYQEIRQTNQGNTQYEQYEQYQQSRQILYQTINQIAYDCQKIRQLDFSSDCIYRQALEQMSQYYPTSSLQELKQKLCKYVINRSFESAQLMGATNKEEQQWCRVSIISEIQELVWYAIIFQQANRLMSK